MCFVFVGVLSLCCGGTRLRLLPSDVLLYNSAVHRHPPHGGKTQHLFPITLINPLTQIHFFSCTLFLSCAPTACRPEPPAAGRGGDAGSKARPPASPRGTATPTPLPPHHHFAGSHLQEPKAPQEAPCGLLSGPHSAGTTHHYGKRDWCLTSA